MKKIILILVALFGMNNLAAQAQTITPAHEVICAQLNAIQAIAELEVASYNVRGYEAITSDYMRLVVNKISQLANKTRAQAGLVDANIVDQMINDMNTENHDTYVYDNYRVSTAANIFNRLNSEAYTLLASNTCSQ